MPTNANVFNSRVTSEALEKKFRDVFPAQGGAELIQDLYASGVIQPVIDFSTVAEGSVLAPNLQTAWDFSTGSATVTSASPTVSLVTTPGFWVVDVTLAAVVQQSPAQVASIDIFDGTTAKIVWRYTSRGAGTGVYGAIADEKFVVFLRAGDILRGNNNESYPLNVWFRQIADVNGNLVNPLGFTFS